jgi:hypothetical protein
LPLKTIHTGTSITDRTLVAPRVVLRIALRIVPRASLWVASRAALWIALRAASRAAPLSIALRNTNDQQTQGQFADESYNTTAFILIRRHCCERRTTTATRRMTMARLKMTEAMEAMMTMPKLTKRKTRLKTARTTVKIMVSNRPQDYMGLIMQTLT